MMEARSARAHRYVAGAAEAWWVPGDVDCDCDCDCDRWGVKVKGFSVFVLLCENVIC